MMCELQSSRLGDSNMRDNRNESKDKNMQSSTQEEDDVETKDESAVVVNDLNADDEEEETYVDAVMEGTCGDSTASPETSHRNEDHVVVLIEIPPKESYGSSNSSGVDCQSNKDGTRRDFDESGKTMLMDAEEEGEDGEEKGEGADAKEPKRWRRSTHGLVPNIHKWNEYLLVVVVGTCLSFNTGYINGACLTGMLSDNSRRQTTAAFTNSYTLAALHSANSDEDEVAFQAFITLSFMFGSYIAGVMNPDPVPYQFQPMYGPTFLVGAIFLFVASVMAVLDGSDRFFYLIAAAAGVQNGISSLYSANLVRSTGLTGTTTDIGIIVGHLCRGNTKDLWKLVVLLALTVAFTLGGFASYYATRRYQSKALLFNAAMFLAIGLSLMLFLMRQLEVSFTAALFGTWKWRRAAGQLRSSNMVFSDDYDDNGMGPRRLTMIELFDKLDVNGDGTIDLSELTVALRVVGIPSSDAAVIMKVVDKDGDGLISRQEWEHACKNLELLEK